MTEKTLVCIVCPRGCRMTLTLPDGDAPSPEGIHVTGNACPRGEAYARQEMTAPQRVLTSTVRLTGAALTRLPVKTSRAVPKERLRDLVRLLDTVTAAAPVHTGDILVKNALGTGADIVATRDMDAIETPE